MPREEYELHVRCVASESEIKQVVQFINDTLDNVSIKYATKEELDDFEEIDSFPDDKDWQ